MAPQIVRRLEVLVLADEPIRQRVSAALYLVARRITTVPDSKALMGCMWEALPEVLIVEGPALAELPTLCRQVRRFFQVPILVVEEGASESERISWLDSGADDVLTLARVASAELAARCHALLRRAQRQQRRDPTSLRMELFNVQLDIPGRRLYPARGQPLDLSAAQTRMLALFFSHGDGVVSIAELAQHMAGALAPPLPKRIASLVQSLNRRLTVLQGPPLYIERVRGNGYRLSPTRTFAAPDAAEGQGASL